MAIPDLFGGRFKPKGLQIPKKFDTSLTRRKNKKASGLQRNLLNTFPNGLGKLRPFFISRPATINPRSRREL
jgi:hypothetical protein